MQKIKPLQSWKLGWLFNRPVTDFFSLQHFTPFNLICVFSLPASLLLCPPLSLHTVYALCFFNFSYLNLFVCLLCTQTIHESHLSEPLHSSEGSLTNVWKRQTHNWETTKKGEADENMIRRIHILSLSFSVYLYNITIKPDRLALH